MAEFSGIKVNATRAKSMLDIVRATFELMKRQPYSTVTVKQICDEAKVTRRTFYRIFQSKESVIEGRFDMMFWQLKQSLELSQTNARNVIRYCFDYFNKERDFAAVFAERDLEHTITAKIMEYVDIAYADSLYNSASFEPIYAEYYHAFIASGIISVMRLWVESGFKHPVHSMTVLAGRLLSGVLL